MINLLMLLNVEWGLKGFQELMNIHPIFVHYPIALFLTSLILYLLGVILKKEQPLVGGQWTLVIGTISAALTVWTGLQAEQTAPHGGGTHDIMTMHEKLGFVILGLGIILSLWTLISRSKLPQKGRLLFLTLLLGLNVILAQSADFGGRMVFLNGVGVGRKSMVPKTQSYEHAGHHEMADEAAHEHGTHDQH